MAISAKQVIVVAGSTRVDSVLSPVVDYKIVVVGEACLPTEGDRLAYRQMEAREVRAVDLLKERALEFEPLGFSHYVEMNAMVKAKKIPSGFTQEDYEKALGRIKDVLAGAVLEGYELVKDEGV